MGRKHVQTKSLILCSDIWPEINCISAYLKINKAGGFEIRYPGFCNAKSLLNWTVEVCEWISSFTPLSIMAVITDPVWYYSYREVSNIRRTLVGN